MTNAPSPGRATPDRAEVPLRPATAKTGTWVSNLRPHTAERVVRFCFLPRPAHRYSGASGSGHSTRTRRPRHLGLTCPAMPRAAWLLYGLGTENQDLPGYITINPSPNFGGASNYGTAFTAPSPPSRNAASATSYNPESACLDAGPLAAPPARFDPGDESRSRQKARCSRSRRRRDPELRAGLPDARPRAGAARHLARATIGARHVRHPGRPARQLRPPMLDGPAFERSRRPFRRNHAIGVGPSQQSAPGPDQSIAHGRSMPDRRYLLCTDLQAAAACSTTRSSSSAASSAGCRRHKGPMAAITTSSAIRCGRQTGAGVQAGFCHEARPASTASTPLEGSDAHNRSARHASGR